MVPFGFTKDEIQAGKEFIQSRLALVRLRGKTNFHGNPFVTYQELVHHVSDGKYHIDNEYDGMRAGNLAEAISASGHSAGWPLLSAVVVAGDTKKPGHGFFALAGMLGMLPARDHYNVDGTEEMTFWNQQVLACVTMFGRK